MFSSLKNLLLPFFLLLAFGSNAQVKAIVKQYSTKDGLPAFNVLCSIKDKEGFMWFGTWVGLCRFDGYSFKTYKSFPGDNSSLQNNRINALLEDEEGFIWLKADDNRIYRFDKFNEKFQALIELAPLAFLKDARVYDMITYNKREIWLRTTSGVILIKLKKQGKISLSRYSHELSDSQHLPSDNIAFINPINSNTVYVGTDKGLVLLSNKEDSFKRSELPSGVQGLNFTSSVKSSANVCFGTSDGDFVILSADGKKLKKYKLSNKAINAVCASKHASNLYYATSGNNLIRIRVDQEKLDKQTVPTKGPMFSIFEDSKGLLFIESEPNGVFKYDPVQNRIRYWLLKNSDSPVKLKVGGNYQITEDLQGNVWIKNGTGFGYYNRVKDDILASYDDLLGTHTFNTSDILWNDREGIVWTTPGLGTIEKYVLSNNHFKQSFIDEKEVSKNDNIIRGILSDSKGRLWIGRRGEKLYIQQNGKAIKGLIDGELPANVYAILEDTKGNIWLGTKGSGLFKAEPTNVSRTHYRLKNYAKDSRRKNAISSNIIYSLLEDKHGQIWAGSFERGLIQVDQSSPEIKFRTIDNFFFNYPGLNHLKVRHLAEDKDGNIWIGSTEGLLVYNPHKGSIRKSAFTVHQKEPNNIKSLGGNDVLFVYKDSNNTMWVLTSAGGLNKAIGSNPLKKLEFKNYSTLNGLSSDHLASCVEDNAGNLWLGTQNSLSRFNINTGQIRNYDAYDGLTGVNFSEASCTKSKDGELIFGTFRGYISFYGDFNKNKKTSGIIALTGLEVNNESFIPGSGTNRPVNINYIGTLALDYSQNNLSITYALLDYRYEDRTHFKFRLLGYDEEWKNNRTLRRVAYTKLEPGVYTFEVQGLDSDYYKNVSAKRLIIIISPPFWKTTWAYLFYTLLFFTAMYLAFSHYIRTSKIRMQKQQKEELDQMKDAFFTNISHEIRTPLTLILTPLDAILQKTDNASLKTQLSGIYQNAKNLLSLVNQLMDFRKVEMHAEMMHLSYCNLTEYLETIMFSFQELSAEKRIDLSFDASEDIYAYIDKDKLRKIINNLLSNAFKFTPAGGSIVLRLAADRQRNHFVISVSDTGLGITEKDQAFIFDRFFQSAHQNDQNHGSGIGLYLVREYVNLHKGSIAVKSVLNKGTTFSLTIPLNPEPEARAVFQNTQQKEGQPATLMVVEDNPEFRTFLFKELSEHYTVVLAVNGKEGLEKARTVQPDLIITDVMMPEMSGTELCRHIKEDLEISHIPVILLTAKASDEAQIQGFEAGADAYITKPFNIHILLLQANRLAEQQQKRKALFRSAVVINPDSLTSTSVDVDLISRALAHIDKNLDNVDYSVEQLSKDLFMDRTGLYRKLVAITGQTPVEFIRSVRLKRAAQLLKEFPVAEVAEKVGFGTTSYFTKCFQAEFGVKPSQYNKRNPPRIIHSD